MTETTLDPALPVQEHNGRTLDWRPRFDPRSLEHRIGAGITELPTTGRLWAAGPVLDQGREGACVGMGCAGEAAAAPVPLPGVDSRYAQAWYRRAQRLDPWPGEAYSGTSVLAGLLEGRARGLYLGFRWAKSAEELAAGIVRPESRGGGPAIIGVEWRAGSYSTDALGVLRPSGAVVGGHCVCVLGWVPALEHITRTLKRDLQALGLWAGVESLGGQCFVIINSWGPGFGINGLALVHVDVMRAWVRAGGEFAMPEGRALGKSTTTSTDDQEQEEQPATASPDRTHHLSARQLEDGDRITEGVPAELGRESVTVQSRRLVTSWRGDLVRVRSSAGVFTLRASAPVIVRRPIG